MACVNARLKIRRSQLPLLACLLMLATGCAEETSQPIGSPEPPAGEVTSASPKNSANEDVESTHALGLLVSVKQLQEFPDRKSLRILDVRSTAGYDSGHIPGAVAVDVGVWKALTLKDDGAGLRDEAGWSAAVGGVGVDNQTAVVVYSDSPTNAARVWWILKYVGVRDVGILDGGWDAWTAAEGEVSTEEVKPDAAEFAVDFQQDRLSVIADLRTSHSSDEFIVVDARSTGEFQGEGDGKGRIPGAAHLEWKELLDDKGQYKSPEELKKLFAAHGIVPEKTAVTHCQTGGRASVNVFALELAGYGKVKNYYCGWSEWSKDDEAPREQGEP